MPHFRYSLQPALEQALAQERAARVAASAAEAAVNTERHALAALRYSVLEARAALHAALELRASATVCLDAAAHAAALRARCAAGRTGLALAERAAARARAAHDVAWRRKSALSRHRERRYETFVAACEQREANELDETNALRRRPA